MVKTMAKNTRFWIIFLTMIAVGIGIAVIPQDIGWGLALVIIVLTIGLSTLFFDIRKSQKVESSIADACAPGCQK
jgi:hypothetical protein